MTDQQQPPPSTIGLTRGAKWQRACWMLAATFATAFIVASLLRPHQPPSAGSVVNKNESEPPSRVRALSFGLIAVASDTPLQKELATTTAVFEKASIPVLSVSGTIIARIRKGTEPIEDRWQFDKPDLSTSYGDWLRAKNEIEFAKSQLNKTEALATAETSFLETNVQRFEGLTGGTIPEKDVRQAKSALLKAQLQGEKDIFAAKSQLRVAEKQKSSIERDLTQAGIEPIVFSRAEEDMVLVVANVPEAKVSQAYEEQACEVQFYGYPDHIFPGHVEAISSVLTQERRTLRVLFDIKDDKSLLKPGMFADVGLGTDARDAILIPAKSLLHIGRKDYVLASVGTDQWRVTEVRVGEVQRDRCEVLLGLNAGDTIISRGAILLKSIAAESLTMPARIAEKQ